MRISKRGTLVAVVAAAAAAAALGASGAQAQASSSNKKVEHGPSQGKANPEFLAKEAAASYADVMRSLGVRQDEALELARRAFDRPVSS